MQISSINPYIQNYGAKSRVKKPCSSAPEKRTEAVFPQSKTENKQKQVNFGSIFIEDVCSIGKVSEGEIVKKFLPKDALLLNKIAQEYPNQDCFILKGYENYPCLEYREKPPEVQFFTKTLMNTYDAKVDADDTEYPTVQLILHKDSVLNKFLGVPSRISLNPSLPYTVKAGYEVHKKLLERKIQIEEKAGNNEGADYGDQSIMDIARNSIEEVEVAVTRYLLECSYAAISDKARAEQLYASNYPKIQPALMAERKLDIITPAAKQHEIKKAMYVEQYKKEEEEKAKKAQNGESIEIQENKEIKDICEFAMQNFPNTEENKARIDELVNYMLANYWSIM